MSAEARQVDASVSVGANPWLLAVVVALAAFMELFDSTIANVAMNYISGAMAVSEDEASWVFTSYLVANAIILTTGGFLAGLLGRKRFLLICLALFTVGSILCGIAWNFQALLLFRILQGFGGVSMAPLAQSILADSFPPAKRGQAFALFGVAVVAAPVIGPTLGGLPSTTAFPPTRPTSPLAPPVARCTSVNACTRLPNIISSTKWRTRSAWATTRPGADGRMGCFKTSRGAAKRRANTVLSRDLDAVSPRGLRPVERDAGGADQLIHFDPRLRRDGHAGGEGDRCPGSRENLDSTEIGSPNGAAGEDVVHRSVRQNDQELLAAVAKGAFPRSRGMSKRRGEAAQHVVADLVAVVVAEHLEMVEIEEHERCAPGVGVSRRQTMRQHVVRSAAIIEAGQVIVFCLVTQASPQLDVLFEPPLQFKALGAQFLANLAAFGRVAQDQQAAAIAAISQRPLNLNPAIASLRVDENRAKSGA